MQRFNLGRFVKTIGIDNAIKEDENYFKELIKCVEKYIQCDWGDLCDEDKQSNEDALKYGERILGAYNTSKGKVYLITEWDRSVTTLLFANEY